MNPHINVPATFSLNAYRVLRVPASADASRRPEGCRQHAAGRVWCFQTFQIDILKLDIVSRREADIRAAVGRLANPVQRLTDRLLWFCELPAPSKAHRTSTAMDPSGHDTVLRDLIDISTVKDGLDEARLAVWVKTLRAWHAVTSDDDYWFLSLMHEDQGGFEPPATSEQVDAVRADAVRIAAEPLIFAARAALVADDRETVRRVRTALSSLTDTGSWASDVIAEIDRGTNGPTGTTGLRTEARSATAETTSEPMEIDPSIFRYVDVFGLVG